MRYIALLRGINAGKERRVDMKKLKVIFESLGYVNVSTYINSGNVIFESKDNQKDILRKIKAGFKKEFAFEIPFLVKTEKEMKKIGSNFHIADRTLVLDFKNAFKIAEKYHAEALCAEASNLDFSKCDSWRRREDSNLRTGVTRSTR